MIIYPDKLLRQTSETVKNIDANFMKLYKQMYDQMKSHNGIGISAVQTGVPLRCCWIMDTFMINPVILEQSKDIQFETEGCLSIPNVWQRIGRSKSIKLIHNSIQGNEIISNFDGAMARIIMHEIDHMNGILFTDHLGPSKSKAVLKKFLDSRKNI